MAEDDKTSQLCVKLLWFDLQNIIMIDSIILHVHVTLRNL